jgi:hypothetical protein
MQAKKLIELFNRLVYTIYDLYIYGHSRAIDTVMHNNIDNNYPSSFLFIVSFVIIVTFSLRNATIITGNTNNVTIIEL